MSKKILFCGIGDIGDAVMKLAVFKSISQTCPDCVISVIAGHWQIPIFQRSQYIKNILHFEYPWGNLYAGSQRGFWGKTVFLFTSGLIQRCQRDNFNIGVTFSGSLFDQTLLWLSGIQQRSGYRQGRLAGLLK